MNCSVRKVRRGDEETLAFIQTESWKAAFKDIISPETLKKCTDKEKSKAMYKELIEKNIGSGYILSVGSKPHCIAWWDKARDERFTGYAELICIHSLKDGWGKGYGGQMLDIVLSDMKAAGYEKAMLWVFEKNERARGFYQAKGFHPTDITVPSLGTTEICYEINFRQTDRISDKPKK